MEASRLGDEWKRKEISTSFLLQVKQGLEPRNQYQNEKKTSEVSVAQNSPRKSCTIRLQKNASSYNENGLLWAPFNIALNEYDSVPTRNQSSKLQLMISVSHTGRTRDQRPSLKFFQEFTFSASLTFDTLQNPPTPNVLSIDTLLPSLRCHSLFCVFQAWITCFLLLDFFKFC